LRAAYSEDVGGNLTLLRLPPDRDSQNTAHLTLSSWCSKEHALTIGAVGSRDAGTVVRMPAGVPHAVDAVEATRVLLMC
jgi:hypothetical protein